MGNASSKASTLTPHISQETAAQGIPHNFSASITKRTSLTLRCILTDPASERAFAVHVPPKGCYDVIVYDGPDAGCPVLATARRNPKWKHDFRINLPALTDGEDTREELLRCTTINKLKEGYWFAMQLGDRVERFEWRSTRGKQVQGQEGSGWGWKLVKGDDEEIVAIFKTHRSLGLNKIGDLTFAGSGITGRFGRQWEIMVVTTWACVWFRHI
ncbi:uncharacterized protein BKA55DRAFT_697656 [Fusarium redolens]|uniref:Uncharacterized protein n=1 Tax=Fusarium redolens TaxID=48865 RepID=A0A9P9FXI8_FUSRE|nr:uncharacterized protein BKA55DRAFT_697656 [Fusarium redolens]KAH7216949.1 hypothetical protein BKA55DRAFT_697656 [Fusarium redolens]